MRLAILILVPGLAFAQTPCRNMPDGTVVCEKAGFTKLVNATIDARAAAEKCAVALTASKEAVAERDAAMSRMAGQITALDAANSGLKKAVLIGGGVSLITGILLGAWIVSR
jgi:hypothetical protein